MLQASVLHSMQRSDDFHELRNSLCHLRDILRHCEEYVPIIEPRCESAQRLLISPLGYLCCVDMSVACNTKYLQHCIKTRMCSIG